MYQQVLFVGNLGRDPEMKYTSNTAKAVCTFSVAVNQTFGKKETVWFDIETWEKQAETCNEYLHKGSKVLVVGRMKFDPATGGPRTWTGKDGQPRARFEVRASAVRFLGGENYPRAATSVPGAVSRPDMLDLDGEDVSF